MNPFNVGDRVLYVGGVGHLHGKVGVVTRTNFGRQLTTYCRVRFGPECCIFVSCYKLKSLLSSKLIDAAKERRRHE